jgi:hypothetical protein
MTHLKSIYALLTLYLLSTSLQASLVESIEDVTLPEKKELNERYYFPMLSINALLSQADSTCNRLPSEEEFKDFISNGKHRSIDCSKPIKAFIVQVSEGEQIGKELPYLSAFLKRDQYQIYSDTKTLFVILKHKPSEWNYKYFKSEDYEYVIHCIHDLKKCHLTRVKNLASGCRRSKTFSKYCHFGNKKVIDY